MLTPAATQVKLEDVTLSETSQTQEDEHCASVHVRPLEEADTQTQGGWGRRGSQHLMGTEFLFGPMRELWRGRGKGCPPLSCASETG